MKTPALLAVISVLGCGLAKTPAPPAMLADRLSPQEIEHGRILTVMEVIGLQQLKLSDREYQAMEAGMAPALIDSPYAFRHRNGTYQVPVGLLERIDEATTDPQQTNAALPAHLRRFEALVIHGMFDDLNAVHLSLRTQYEQFGKRSELATQHGCHQFCQVRCNMVIEKTAPYNSQAKNVAAAGANTGCHYPATQECFHRPRERFPDATLPSSVGSGSYSEGHAELSCDAYFRNWHSRRDANEACRKEFCSQQSIFPGTSYDSAGWTCNRQVSLKVVCQGDHESCAGMQFTPWGYETGVISARAEGSISGARAPRPPDTTAEVSAYSKIELRNWWERQPKVVDGHANVQPEAAADCGELTSVSCGVTISTGDTRYGASCRGEINLKNVACVVIDSFRDKSPKPATMLMHAYSTLSASQLPIVLGADLDGQLNLGPLGAETDYELLARAKRCKETDFDNDLNGTKASARTGVFSQASSTLQRVEVFENNGKPVEVEVVGATGSARRNDQPKFCRVNDDCDVPGENCVNGLCLSANLSRPEGAVSGDSCGSHSSCPQWHACIDEHCYDLVKGMRVGGTSATVFCGRCDGSQCRFGSHAAELRDAYKPVEFPEPEPSQAGDVPACQSDEDCDGGFFGDDKICDLETCECRPCERDEECDEGMVCRNETCVEEQECEVDEDCEEGDMCTDGECTPEGDECGPGLPACPAEMPCCSGGICETLEEGEDCP